MEKGEIVIYQPNDSICLEVRIDEETVWLNRQQMAVLFDRDVKTIGKHINNALNQELMGESTIANFATVQKEGDRLVTRNVDYYNLDMVLSVGYRFREETLRFFENGDVSRNSFRNYKLNGFKL